MFVRGSDCCSIRKRLFVTATALGLAVFSSATPLSVRGMAFPSKLAVDATEAASYAVPILAPLDVAETGAHSNDANGNPYAVIGL